MKRIRNLEMRSRGAIGTEAPNVHWEDVAGLELFKEELQEAVILPPKPLQLFTGRRPARRGVLMYGPPGTGKSYLAKALATECNATLFSISSSNIVSKGLGESEKLVKTLLKMARERKPCVNFIDELGGIASSPDSSGTDNEHTNRIKTEILVQMGGVGKGSTGILALTAADLPWKLDAALRRRFHKRIYIGLPDRPARKRLFELGGRDTQCTLAESYLDRLASMTEGHLGTKKIYEAKYWKRVLVVGEGIEKLEPCAEDDARAMQMIYSMQKSGQFLALPLGIFFPY
ncbi:AAA-domain-containing protein [Lindgomyces ingoldianus]|uniref:AAA-domain-containing protein n=1 Tax=Lindgomyces ingoldianus TaxID=673940 RepID=A0ACB6RAM8_9PLEO|nr:AAA-domain-containing protein [Lindgomyces ingoldianus]KAF2476338.1 AAA-domain-containing protein [Lindgomyces ingoldianus]